MYKSRKGREMRIPDGYVVLFHDIHGLDVEFETRDLVLCKNCKHRPKGTGANHDLEFPDDVCPCQCEDDWYSWKPNDDWFCADGERKEE